MNRPARRARDDTSPLDRPLPITIWADARAKAKTNTERSLRELARLIPKRSAATKSELRLLKLASFGRKRSKHGSLRNNANVVTINGVECDYDDERMSVFEVVKRLRKAGIAALVYTSPSHRPDKPRWRILCPTSRSLPPVERERLVARINGIVGGKLAIESFTLSQIFFYGQAEIAEDNKTGESWPGYPIETMLVEGRYIDLADDLDAGALDKHGKPYDREPVEPEKDDDSDDDDMAREPDVERIKRALERIPSADYVKHWLPVGMALHHEFDGSEDGFELWDEWSQSSDNYDADKLREKWDSFGSYSGRPTAIGTLYDLANDDSPSANFGELTFLTPGECGSLPPRGYVWKRMIAPRDVVCIFGEPGAGKSLIAPHIGYMVALGDTAFGLRTKLGRVLYVAAEAHDSLCERVDALKRRYGDTDDFVVVGGVSDLFDKRSPAFEALLEAVEDQRPALIVIDTLALAFPGLEENEPQSMGRVIRVARQLTEHGAAVVLVHHPAKGGDTPRGHGSLNGACDVTIRVERDGEVVRARMGKNRNGTQDRDIAFKIGTVKLGTDEDGEPITAPFVEELSGIAAARPPHLSTTQREALAILAELEAEGSVAEEAWRDACIDGRRVSQSEDRDSRKRTFNNVRKALAEKGLIAFQLGNVALAELTSEDDL